MKRLSLFLKRTLVILLSLSICGCAGQEQPIDVETSTALEESTPEESTGQEQTEASTGRTTASATSVTTTTEKTTAEEETKASSTSAAETAGTSAPSVPESTTSAATTGTAQGTTKPPATTTAPSTGNGQGNGSGLSESSGKYTGTAGTGSFNYGEALQKSLLFYELQRSGDLPADTRTNWRGDSGMSDGADNGVDLIGGLYDAGDNVKFNLPMAYTASVLAWSVYEDKDAYIQSGQLEYALGNIKWICDYLIKCHTAENEFYYQVGDGNLDHSWWGPAEVMSMNRPSYKVTLQSPGSTVTAEAAAALAAASVVFKDSDPAYAQKCLTHAKQLYNFAETAKSDSGYTAANGFYTSFSGFTDELMWAATWLYTASGDKNYLTKAGSYFDQKGSNPRWTMSWDDVSDGAVLRLAIITGENKYKTAVQENMNFWLNEITYTPKGLAWLDTWGSLRYSTTAAFLAAVYSESSICPANMKDKCWNFALSQIDYALGSTGRSYVCGFGVNPPQHPHHRTSQGSYCNNMNTPETARHTLYGALVGGPDRNDNYKDVVSDYTANEVACDYNAGFTGALAKMYSRYGGKTLSGFGAVEPVPENEELFVEAGINASGNNFTEIKAIVYNRTGWPARVTTSLKLRYFIDISEIISAGGSAADLSVNGNYMQGGKLGNIQPWDADKGIYYLEVDFTGEQISPASQDACKREVQFRITSSSKWDPSNDFSYQKVNRQNGSVQLAPSLALYEGGTLVFGAEPGGKIPSTGGSQTTTSATAPPVTTPTTTPSTTTPTTTTASTTVPSVSASGGLTVTSATSSESNTSNVNINIEITNNGSAISLNSLEVRYYLTSDGGGELVFYCDHTAIQKPDSYLSLSGLNGKFESASGTDVDTVCRITCGDNATLGTGDIWRIQGRIAKADWSTMDCTNDYSNGGSNYIVIYSGGNKIYGTEP